MDAIDGPGGFKQAVGESGVASQETVGPTFDASISAYDGSAAVRLRTYIHFPIKKSN